MPAASTFRQRDKFDEESGQVFLETSVATRRHTYWINEFKTPNVAISRPSLNSQGSRSLLAMAKTKAIKEIHSLDTEHFADLPWSVAEAMWQEIVESHKESYHAWRILAASYPGTSEFGRPDHRYHLQIRQPALPLESYFSGITSGDRSWLTAIRISPKETRTPDLLSIAKVKNLTVLDVSDGQKTVDTISSPLDQRLIKTWSNLATSGSFRNLQVLLLGWQEHVDNWLFGYLPCFPNLKQVILTDCPRLHQKNRKDWADIAAQYGWEARHSKSSAKSLRPHLKESGFPLGAVSGLYYTTEKPEAICPLLECWIGMPRKWTHILDDFPGTRTVFFDRVRKALPANKAHIAPLPTTKRERGDLGPMTRLPEPKRSAQPKLRQRRDWKNGLDDLLAQYNSNLPARHTERP